MNAENFSEYIQSNSNLYKISYQELKSLVLQYPYCSNLRYLLLQKSHQEGNKDFNRNLEQAATRSPDRHFLFQQVQQWTQERELNENYQLEEEFLELKDLSELSLEEIPSVVEPPETASRASLGLPDFQVPKTENLKQPEPLEEETVFEWLATTIEPSQEALKPTTHPTTPKISFEIPYSLILTLVAGSIASQSLDFEAPGKAKSQAPVAQGQPAPEMVKKLRKHLDKLNPGSSHVLHPPLRKKSNAMPKPTPKSSFTSWLEQFQSPNVRLQLDHLMEVNRAEESANLRKPAREKSPAKVQQARKLARQSLEERDEIASVTLATLLEKQGYHEKAIAMYERLGMIFPEKKAFFAEKIQTLKQHLD